MSAPAMDMEMQDRLEGGREKLDELVAAVTGAEDRTAAAEAIGVVMSSKDALTQIGAVAEHEPGVWAAAVAKLRTVKGLSASVRDLG